MCAYRVCACKYRHTCLCSYLVYGCVLCVCRCIHIYMYTRKTPWVHTDTLHWVRIGIHTYVSVFVRVCVFIHMYTCIYDKTSCAHTNLHVCVYILAYMQADFTCGYLHVLIYACVCIYIYIYVRRVYMCMCTYLHIGRRVYLCSCICLHICTPSL